MIEKDHVNNDQYVNICLQKGRSGDHGLVFGTFQQDFVKRTSFICC